MPNDFLQNPFTMVWDGHVALLKRWPNIDKLVNAGNLVTFNTANPLKRTVITGEVPEIMLLTDGGPVSMHNTSHTSKCVMRYSWVISSGDFRIQRKLHQLEWAVYSAMHGIVPTLTKLRWPDNTEWEFVKRVDIISVQKGIADKEHNRGIQGWSSVWQSEVEMHFRLADLKSQLLEDT